MPGPRALSQADRIAWDFVGRVPAGWVVLGMTADGIGLNPLVWADSASAAALVRSTTSFIRGAILDEVVGARDAADATADSIAGRSTSDRRLRVRLTQPGFLTSKAHLQGVQPGPYSYLAQWNVEQWWRQL